MYPHPSQLLALGGVQAEYLVVGGGGGGGDSPTRGGLGGQVLTGTLFLVRAAYAVTIGPGGAGGAGGPGAAGTATSFAALATASGGAPETQVGAGVNGTSSSITGSAVIYGSSGGEQGFAGGDGGGDGFGGVGPGGPGVANRGGGGGGGADGGPGGSGVFIIRYLGPAQATGGTITTVGLYTVHTFTSSGTFTVI